MALVRSAVRRAALGLLGLGAGGFACANVLGIQDRTLDPDLGDGGMVTGGDTGSPTGSEGGAPDAGDAGPCGNTQADPDNCGRCGHSCLGGGCEGGVCQPLTLADKIQAWDVAVDSQYVYWTQPSDGLVMRADKSTGDNKVTLLSGPTTYVFYPYHIAIDQTNVYVSDIGTGYIVSCAIVGCGNNPTPVASFPDGGTETMNQNQPNRLAIGGGYVYFSDVTSSIWRTPKTGGRPLQKLATYDPILTSGMNMGMNSSPEAVAVDDTSVYWQNDDGTIQKVGLDGGSPQKVGAGPQQSPGELAVANGTVYFDQGVDPGGTIESVPTSGGTPNILQGSQHLPAGIAADPNFIYWVTQGSEQSLNNGTVMMCSVTNCASPTQLASAQLDAIGIAIDDTAVYWANDAFETTSTGESGSVMKVAKP
jgi:hypothetical protein